MLQADETSGRLESDLRHAIFSGALEPSTRLMSVRSLAEKYGVTYGKTLRALKRLEKQGLLVSRHGGGTFVTDVLPHQAGAAFPIAPRNAAPVALVVAPRYYWNLGEGVWLTEYIRGFETRLRSSGHTFEILATEEYLQPSGARPTGPHFHVLFGTPELLRQFPSGRDAATFILIGSDPACSSWAFTMDIDGERGIGSATRHLLDMNHRNITMLSWEMPDELREARWWNIERERAFKKIISDAGLKPSIIRFPHPVGQPTPAELQEVERLLAAQVFNVSARPTAVVCVNDFLAQNVIKAAVTCGVKLPEQLSVIGFDDEPWTVTAGLTTLNRPYREMGTIVAEMALQQQRNSGHRFRGSFMLEPALIQRRSVQRLAY